MARIPVKLIRIEDITEVSMDLDDFESSGVEIGNNVKALKDGYDELIAEVKPVLSRNGNPSTTERWRACRKLADFVDRHDKFDIKNFPTACAKDMGLSGSFRLMVSFGREFDEKEVLDSIPYTSYRVLILKMNALKQRGMFKSEKARLIRTGEHLDHKNYTKYLNGLHMSGQTTINGFYS